MVVELAPPRFPLLLLVLMTSMEEVQTNKRAK